MNVNQYASLERRIHALEERAGAGKGDVHVVMRDSPDTTKEQALDAYVARTGRRPAPEDSILWFQCVRTREDIARYDEEQRTDGAAEALKHHTR